MRKFLFFLLFTFSPLIGVKNVCAQDNDLNKFVGVWSTDKTNGAYGNIKISIKDGALFLSMKTDSGVKQFENVKVNGNKISWSYVDEINYGRWHIGMWTWVSSGKREECIIVDNRDGTKGTNGAPTKVYARRTADREVSHWGFVGELHDDVLDLSYECWSDYFAGNELVFMQSSNLIFYSSYTNW